MQVEPSASLRHWERQLTLSQEEPSSHGRRLMVGLIQWLAESVMDAARAWHEYTKEDDNEE